MVVPFYEFAFVIVVSVILSLAALYALWPWARSARRLVVIAVAMSLGIIAWNVALNVGNAASFNVDTLFLGLSLQDVGSSVVAFITTALALGLVSGGREPANRIVVAAAIVGVVTLVVDRFG